MATQGLVTKIYRLETQGYADRHKEFQQLATDLQNIKKLIVDLQGKSVGLKGTDLSAVNKQIGEALVLNDQLEKKMTDVNKTTDTSVSKYYQLSQAYKAAKESAQDLAAEYGVESEQAQAAATKTAALKQQLTDINNLVKNGKSISQIPLITATQAPIAATADVGQLANEQAELQKTGEVVDQLNIAEAEAANAALAMGSAQQSGGRQIADAGVQVSQVTTKYEEYTGTIRQNIIAQIENNNQLAINRAAQKDIQVAMAAQQGSTETQINQLAALKEEEQLLIESNKALTITIRNQSKEFIAAAGSLDEAQAQLNQLQQSYEALTATEKASPFGAALKSEIDQLEPSVKSLEAELGKFQRNVGNYPTVFTGAFKVLSDQLDTVKGKLVQGNFTGASLADLTAQEQVLSTATQTLGQEFATTSAQASAFKQVGLELATVYGADSAIFKNFSVAVAQGNTQINATNAAMNATNKTGNIFANGFKSIYGYLRNIANIIPGLGVGSLLLLLITPLTSLGSTLLTITRRTKDAKDSLHDYSEELQDTKDVITDANKQAGSEIANLQLLYKAASDVNKPMQERLKAVEALKTQFPEYFGQLNNEIILNGKAADSYKALAAAIEATARTEAGKKKIGDLTSQILDIDEKRQQINTKADQELKDAKTTTVVTSAGGTATGTGSSETTFSKEDEIRNINIQRQKKLDDLQKQEEVINNRIDNIAKLIVQPPQPVINPSGPKSAIELQSLIDNVSAELKTLKEGDPKLTELEKQRDAYQKRLDAILKKPSTKGSQISGAEKDALKDIDAVRDTLLTNESTKRLEDQTSEQDYLRNILKINEDAIAKKLALIKGKNASERLLIAQLNNDKVKLENDTNQKLFDLDAKAAKDQLNQQIADIQLKRDQLLQDPTLSETARAQIKIDADNQILQLQTDFNANMDQLQKDLNDTSVNNAKIAADDLKKTQEQLLKDQEEAATATLKDIQTQGKDQIAQFKELISEARLAIQNDSNLSATDKSKSLTTLNSEENFGILTRELDNLTKQLPEYKALLEEKKITDTQYTEFVTTLNEKQKQVLDAFTTGIVGNVDKLKGVYALLLQLGKITQSQYDKLLKDIDNTINSGAKKAQKSIASIGDILQHGESADKSGGLAGFLDNISDVDPDTDKDKADAIDKAVGQAVQESYSLAQQAMTSYFDAEEQRINQSLQSHLDLIDVQRQQAEATAQSQAEIDSIEKQAAAAKKQAQKQAGDELKKAKKSEAKIALATQLVNVAVEASQYPFPASLIIFGILSALALANYAIQVATINRETFAKGGTIPSRGGRISGASHAQGGVPFSYNNKYFEAEGGEAIINKRSVADKRVRTITGTNEQILSLINYSGGGLNFASGAKGNLFASGGVLGGSLQAPVDYRPSILYNQNNGEVVAAIRDLQQQHEQLGATIQDLAKEQSDRIDRLEVYQVTGSVTKAQAKEAKQTSVGKLGK